LNISIRSCVSAAACVALAGGLVLADRAMADAATVPFASVANNTLTITGTAGGDSISIDFVDFATPDLIQVNFGNDTLPQTFDSNTFTAIAVFLGRGDDRFSMPPGPAPLGNDALTVDGDGGNDTIVGGPGDDLINGGAGADDLRGGPGDDVIFGNGGDDLVDGGIGTDTEILGGGNDTALWNPGEGSDAVNGGADADTLQFNGSNIGEVMALSANGARAVLTRNVAAIRMDLANLEQVDVRVLGSVDSFALGDLTGTDVTGVNVDLASSSGTPDESADTVSVRGTGFADSVRVTADGSDVVASGLPARVRVSGAEPADHLQVNTVGGNDNVNVSDAARAVMDVGVDLGTGQR